MLKSLLKQTPYLQHAARQNYTLLLLIFMKQNYICPKIEWVYVFQLRQLRVAPDTKFIKCWTWIPITDFPLSIDNHRLHWEGVGRRGEAWSYIQIAEILSQLLSYKEVESTNLFHRMQGKGKWTRRNNYKAPLVRKIPLVLPRLVLKNI